MRIDIVYDSCWKNSFLTGVDNKPIDSHNERKFKATSKSKIIDNRDVSHSTVMGILCRLIGDQRKLYQSRQDEDYYFKDIESFVEFRHRKKLEYSETAYIINKSDGRPPQGGFLGVLPNENKLFFSNYSQNLWRIFEMDFIELLNYILNGDEVKVALGHASPKVILSKIDAIQAMDPYQTLTSKRVRLVDDFQKLTEKATTKTSLGKKLTATESERLEQLKLDIEFLEHPDVLKFDELVQQCSTLLGQKYQEKQYLDKNTGKLYPISLYASALYLTLERLKDIGFDTSVFVNKNNNIQGFNRYGFNGVRDFLNPLTGGEKQYGGTPTQLTKASGILEITLNIPHEKACEINEMIENAGVSAFYLGKKGLAYVEKISTKEETHA